MTLPRWIIAGAGAGFLAGFLLVGAYAFLQAVL